MEYLYFYTNSYINIPNSQIVIFIYSLAPQNLEMEKNILSSTFPANVPLLPEVPWIGIFLLSSLNTQKT